MFGYINPPASISNIELVNINVSGNNSVGGLVGYSSGGDVDNSSSSGSVSAGAASAKVGGLVGYSSGGSVDNSYSSGSVSGGLGSTNVGGLCGQKTGTVSNSYWDNETSGLSNSACGTGNTTAQMKTPANYVGWDTTNIWTIAAGSYPRLRWQG